MQKKYPDQKMIPELTKLTKTTTMTKLISYFAQATETWIATAQIVLMRFYTTY